MENNYFFKQTDRISLFITVFICSLIIVFDSFILPKSENTRIEPVNSKVLLEIISIDTSSNKDAVNDSIAKENIQSNAPIIKDDSAFVKKNDKKEFRKDRIQKKSDTNKKLSTKSASENPHNNLVQEELNEQISSNEDIQISALEKDLAVSNLLEKISKIKKYPNRAIKTETQGECLLSFGIDIDGNVKFGSLVNGSSSIILDTECKRIISSLIGFNVSVKGHKMSVNVPIIFTLKN